MKHRRNFFVAVFLTSLISVPYVNAQKGMGETKGVAQQAMKPAVTSLSGKVLEIKTGPCEKTTGPSTAGTHLIVQSNGAKFNIHLGPEKAVDHITEQLSIGLPLTVDVFQTDGMPVNSYIAKSIILDDKIIHLRDNNLRPSWAYGRAKEQEKKKNSRAGGGKQGPCW